MFEPANTPATYTFVLRLWQEWTEDALRWRGWIEHVPSGEQAAVQDWDGVMAFMRRYGVGRTEDREQRPEGGEQRLEMGRWE